MTNAAKKSAAPKVTSSAPVEVEAPIIDIPTPEVVVEPEPEFIEAVAASLTLPTDAAYSVPADFAGHTAFSPEDVQHVK